MPNLEQSIPENCLERVQINCQTTTDPFGKRLIPPLSNESLLPNPPLTRDNSLWLS